MQWEMGGSLQARRLGLAPVDDSQDFKPMLQSAESAER